MSSQVMDYVRDSVQSGTMDTESWYSVYQLAEKLEISRSPVREGLLRLEEAGLIEFVRNRGFRIIETKPEEVSEIFALRLGIEPKATARAARLRTEQQVDTINELLELMSKASEKNNESEFFHWDQLLHEQILAAGHS
ncbi:GntR family transcriptional regulator, partial [Corynebacterium stationis]|uniref:GntR family transcriptional regulator n=1 Tax=Corynebacterium stationis TaxID=1705 RepID=UPI00241F466F